MKTETAIPQIGNMSLKTTVLEFINTVSHRIELARIMKVGEQTIIKYIDNNDLKLTQWAPLQYIKNEMGVAEVSELLESQKAV